MNPDLCLVPPFLKSLLLLTALAAVLWAQACGLHRGYYCACSCLPLGGHLTQVDNCHEGAGHHTDHGHEHEHDHEHALPHEHDGDDTGAPVSHTHPEVVDTLTAHLLSNLPVTAPPALEMDWQSAWIHGLSPLLPASALIEPPREVPRRCPPGQEWPYQIAQSISLRL